MTPQQKALDDIASTFERHGARRPTNFPRIARVLKRYREAVGGNGTGLRALVHDLEALGPEVLQRGWPYAQGCLEGLLEQGQAGRAPRRGRGTGAQTAGGEDPETLDAVRQLARACGEVPGD